MKDQQQSVEGGAWTGSLGGRLEYRISGGTAQLLEIKSAGEPVYSRAGAMIWMAGMEMSITGGGISQGVARMLGGGGFFLAKYTPVVGGGMAAFSARKIGPIVALEVGKGPALFCERETFLAAVGGVEVTAGVQRNIGAGFFGGEGFVLQKILGEGIVFLTAGGCVGEYHLKDGEVFLVDPGHVAFFEETVSYRIEPLRGVKTIALGNEGFLLAKLTGPGRVWTQSHPQLGIREK